MVFKKSMLPNEDIISPGIFLPLLNNKELDILLRMGLEQALSQISKWDKISFSIDLSINLSPSSLFDKNLPKLLKNLLKKYSIAPNRLTLELLETQSCNQSLQDKVINEISNLGIELAMEDLGSGYSSLQRLLNLPFNIIKIDQTLLSKIRTTPLQTLCLIETILQIGNDFERRIAVEGL